MTRYSIKDPNVEKQLDIAKVAPWVLVTILVGVCWQQQQTIHALGKEKPTNMRETNPVTSNGKIQKNVVEKIETSTRNTLPKELQPIRQNQPEMVLPNPEQIPSNEELEDLIEHRVVERLEEIEEEKRQKRVEQMTDHMQSQVNEWSEEFLWSKETQNAMMDILTDYVHARVEVHVLLKNETIDREGIRPYFQQVAKERNAAIIELVGADDFAEMEENLHPRGGNK